MALTSLYNVLLTVCRVMSPYTPFFTETMYQNLRKVQSDLPDSLHWLEFPTAKEVSHHDEALNTSVERMMMCCQMGHTIRTRNRVNLKTPLKMLTVVHGDQEFLDNMAGQKLGFGCGFKPLKIGDHGADMHLTPGELKEYIMEEVNVQCLETCSDPLKFSVIRAEPEWGVSPSPLPPPLPLCCLEAFF